MLCVGRGVQQVCHISHTSCWVLCWEQLGSAAAGCWVPALYRGPSLGCVRRYSVYNASPPPARPPCSSAGVAAWDSCRWRMQSSHVQPGTQPSSAASQGEVQATIRRCQELSNTGKKYKKPRQYIVDQQVADTLTTHLLRDLKAGDVVVESSPGPGVLTHTLLHRTTNTVVAYERHQPFREALWESVGPAQRRRLQLCDLNLELFFYYHVLDRRDPEGRRLSRLLEPLPRRSPSHPAPVKLAAVINNKLFFHSLILSYTYQCSLFRHIFPHLYIYMPHHLYEYISSKSKHRSKWAVLFQYFFSVELLDTAPPTAFYPRLPNPPSSRGRDSSNNRDISLLKITPSEDLFKVVRREELESFHYFMRTMSSTTDTLINCLEAWIPQCGPVFIRRGVHVFAHPRQLGAQQLVAVFRLFTQLPSYPDSVFHHHCHQFELKFGARLGDSLDGGELGQQSHHTQDQP